MNFRDLVKLSKEDVVRGLHKLKLTKSKGCEPSQQRELIEEKIVSLEYVHTNTQLSYLFTKALDFQTPGPNDTSIENGNNFGCSDDEIYIYDDCSPLICLDSTNFHQDTTSNSAKTYSTGSSNSNTINRFVAMGFSGKTVVKAIEENGEDNEASILDSLLTYSALEKSPQQCQSIPGPSSSDSESNLGYNDLSIVNSSPAAAPYKKYSNKSLEKEEKLWVLVDMGYTAEEAFTAMAKCGPDAQIAELTDFISAAELEKELDVQTRELPEEEVEKSHSQPEKLDFPGNKKRKFYKDKSQGSGDLLRSPKKQRLNIPKPMIGFGVPDEPRHTVERNLPETAAGRPYFYYENVAMTAKGVWNTISRFLYDIEPEFVDSIYFCACARKRGYIHNLPINNRFPLLPRPPRTIQEALPWTKTWWPSWDKRTKFNCIHSRHGNAKLTEKIRLALEEFDGEPEPPLHVQKYVLGECRKWNLVWVGKNKVAPIETGEMEMLMGFPKNHTRGGGVCTGDRYAALGNSFQVDTVAYHLSALKEQFPNGVNVLSLFSGIGGAEVALHRLGIPLKNVVSIEISEANRNIVRSWWKETNQCGSLIELVDVQEVTGNKLEQYIRSLGGFDLVIGGSPCNNLSGCNRVSRVGLEGEHSSLFYEYFRILDLVKCLMGNV
ncbi:DNA (cytosine-5)-methyltransferase DRM2-like [Mangifera indica]|uniref:DNA (cytosine-5)-methyltransferase DRM2-like n=1 Tax=Mangifera indica TaxID=29780 RepID=UPI001CFABC16|nr:DNA (cytosine-5)-methyltransferase DRM2-like [Mangifera indica]